jgi:hypothetical protein
MFSTSLLSSKGPFPPPQRLIALLRTIWLARRSSYRNMIAALLQSDSLSPKVFPSDHCSGFQFSSFESRLFCAFVSPTRYSLEDFSFSSAQDLLHCQPRTPSFIHVLTSLPSKLKKYLREDGPEKTAPSGFVLYIFTHFGVSPGGGSRLTHACKPCYLNLKNSIPAVVDYKRCLLRYRRS